MINITCVLVDRANYGRLKPLLTELRNDKDINLNIVCCGSTVLRRFHRPVFSIHMEFEVTHEIFHEVEGSVVNSMSMLMPQLTMAFKELKPDYVLIIGDRFEALAVATVAHMMGLCLIHVQGGEHSGNVDDSIRHAITKLAHYHLPATQQAKSCILDGMGEATSTILGVGCPSADMVDIIKKDEMLHDFVLCIYHPETNVRNSLVMAQLLNQLSKLKRNVIMLWPNIDPDSNGINKVIRRYIDNENPNWLSMIVNVEPEHYLQMIASVRCCVGNSSSFVRDSSFFGTPVVLVGNRQLGRTTAKNVQQYSGYDLSKLHLTIASQMQKTFEPTCIYGKAGISKWVVEQIKKVKPYSMKVHYV